MSAKTCNRCGAGNLRWVRHGGHWSLAERGTAPVRWHSCTTPVQSSRLSPDEMAEAISYLKYGSSTQP